MAEAVEPSQLKPKKLRGRLKWDGDLEKIRRDHG
jgi:hypothetical protein